MARKRKKTKKASNPFTDKEVKEIIDTIEHKCKMALSYADIGSYQAAIEALAQADQLIHMLYNYSKSRVKHKYSHEIVKLNARVKNLLAKMTHGTETKPKMKTGKAIWRGEDWRVENPARTPKGVDVDSLRDAKSSFSVYPGDTIYDKEYKIRGKVIARRILPEGAVYSLIALNDFEVPKELFVSSYQKKELRYPYQVTKGEFFFWGPWGISLEAERWTNPLAYDEVNKLLEAVQSYFNEVHRWLDFLPAGEITSEQAKSFSNRFGHTAAILNIAEKYHEGGELPWIQADMVGKLRREWDELYDIVERKYKTNPLTTNEFQNRLDMAQEELDKGTGLLRDDPHAAEEHAYVALGILRDIEMITPSTQTDSTKRELVRKMRGIANQIIGFADERQGRPEPMMNNPCTMPNPLTTEEASKILDDITEKLNQARIYESRKQWFYMLVTAESAWGQLYLLNDYLDSEAEVSPAISKRINQYLNVASDISIRAWGKVRKFNYRRW